MEGINEHIVQANQSGKTLEGPQLSLNTPMAQTNQGGSISGAGNIPGCDLWVQNLRPLTLHNQGASLGDPGAYSRTLGADHMLGLGGDGGRTVWLGKGSVADSGLWALQSPQGKRCH